MKVKIVFFDCDGVLIFGNPWIRLHRVMGISEELDQKWLNQFLKGEITNTKWTRNIEEYYIKNKLTKAEFEDILNLKNFVFNKEAYPLINFLKKEGIEIAIISSGIAYYVSMVANHFGIKYWRDNANFIFDKEGIFTNIKFGLDDLDQKVKDINDISTLLNISHLESIFIGDAGNDTKAFEHTKRGILYKTKNKSDVEDTWDNLDTKLLKASWKKIDNLESVIDIIKDINAKD